MIKIEILSESANNTSAAFYYPVPPGQQLPAAIDQSREPSGSALSAEEVQDLKDGKIVEYLWLSDTGGLDVPQRQSRLVNEWGQNQADAISRYKTDYEAVGQYYDGQWH